MDCLRENTFTCHQNVINHECDSQEFSEIKSLIIDSMMDPQYNKTTEVSDTGDEEEFLPEHTISMRKALAYCRKLIEDHNSRNINSSMDGAPWFLVAVDKDAFVAATTIPIQREKALLHFWGKQRQDHCFKTDAETRNAVAIATIDVASGAIKASPPVSASSTMGPDEFRRTFQNGNIPCLIRGLDKTPYFSSVCAKWRTPPTRKSTENADAATRHAATINTVNRQWFLETVGKDTKVPVRYQVSSCSTTGADLDDDGRAQECETKEMALHEWIGLLDEGKLSDASPLVTSSSSDVCANPSVRGDFYLKDWHLQSNLRQSTEQVSTEKNLVVLGLDGYPIYQVPPYFQYDLLNAFLTKFTDSGDYMFTYVCLCSCCSRHCRSTNLTNSFLDYLFSQWGPKGSRTTRHSDVMNSFSWSFNVAGSKEWTFYPPSPMVELPSQHGIAAVRCQSDPLVLVQTTGETIFVPCGWQHEVRNLEETLSINHNWITTSNFDQTWRCMEIEMLAIEGELRSWGMSSDCWEARESMLRGCLGLDITAYFFMLMTRLLEIIIVHLSENGGDSCLTATEMPTGPPEEYSGWQHHFDLVRLTGGLSILLESSKGSRTQADSNTTMELIGLEERLAAVLGSRKDAVDAVEMARRAIAAIDYPLVESDFR